jgi:hypothetical protein
MHYIKYVLSFILLLVLAGCNDTPDDVRPTADAKVYFDQQLKTTLAAAKSKEDPFEAYQLLLRAYYGLGNDKEKLLYKDDTRKLYIAQSGFVVNGGSALDNKQEAINNMYVYLESALKNGNKKAFLELYEGEQSEPANFGNDMTMRLKSDQLQTKFSEAYKNLVETLSVGDPIDNALITSYASQLKNGEFYQKNTAKSVEYYLKLYPVDKVVPLYLIGVYLDINDYENAYFWKVRCIDACDARYKKISIVSRNLPDLFRKQLTSDQFKAIEEASNDPTRTSFK